MLLHVAAIIDPSDEKTWYVELSWVPMNMSENSWQSFKVSSRDHTPGASPSEMGSMNAHRGGCDCMPSAM